MSEEVFGTGQTENTEHAGSREGFYASQSGDNSERRPYQNNSYNNGGYRPRFNSGNRYGGANGEGGYRPRYQNAGGYRPRTNNYGDQEGTAYGERPRQNGGHNNGYRQQGGYNRQGGYRQQGQGNYRPYNNDRPAYRPNRFNAGEATDNFDEGTGFRPNRPAQGGYRQRTGSYNNGYNRQQGGYNRQGGYNNGYNNRRQGGYDPHAKYSQKKRLEYKEEHIDPNAPIRLNRYLANAGICSRRDADKYIEAGVVTVNGEVVTELGTKVLRSDVVQFHEQPVKIEKKVYVLLNKPKGYVTTSEDPQNRKTVMDLVKNCCPERIYPVGRLDRNTTGVLLLTNDGDMASKLTHPKFLKKKIYHVCLDKNLTAADLNQIAEGITLEDGDIKADAIEYASPTDKKQIGIEIHSGRNRIVRRIFESLGYHVTKLDRVYFAGLTKKNVKRGDWRFLTEKEVNMLRMGAFE